MHRFTSSLRMWAPCGLVIRVRPAREAELAGLRAVARQWREIASGMQDDLVVPTGSGRSSSRLGSFDRFLAPAVELCRIEVCVHARDTLAAQAVGAMFGQVFAGPGALRLRGGAEVADAGASPWSAFSAALPSLYHVDEAAHLLSLPVATLNGMPGMEFRRVSPFVTPAIVHSGRTAAIASPDIELGRICPQDAAHAAAHVEGRTWSEEALQVPLESLTRHVLVSGTTGSGKTTWMRNLLAQAHGHQVPFLVVESAKTEYFSALSASVPSLHRVGFAGDEDGGVAADFLAFDPMLIPDGTSVSTHVACLRACFEAAFPMTQLLSMVLESGLFAYYTKPAGPPWHACGYRLLARSRITSTAPSPTFEGFCAFFLDRFLVREVAPPESLAAAAASEMWARYYEWRQLFRRRFENLLAGPVGVAFARGAAESAVARGDGRDPFDVLLQEPTILELDALTEDSHKALVAALVFSRVYERRHADALREAVPRGAEVPAPQRLRHLLVVEEAHRILGRDSPGVGIPMDESGGRAAPRSASLFAQMLAEVRAYGQGLLVVEQSPAKLIEDVMRNTATKVLARTVCARDRAEMSSSMGLSREQRAYVRTLPTGQVVVAMAGAESPILVSVPWQEAKGDDGESVLGHKLAMEAQR